MVCVTLVRYQVKFNGTLLDSFGPTGSLRQGDPLSYVAEKKGDPLSPFLCLFVADGLSALLQEATTNDTISPLKVCWGAPGISHLVFADHSLLFFKADANQAECVSVVLQKFGRATGQLVNLGKCSIMFGEACPVQQQNIVKHILQVTRASFEMKYLGLPTPESRMYKGHFQNLQSHLRKRLIEGGECQIKSIAQAIPTYVMGSLNFQWKCVRRCQNL